MSKNESIHRHLLDAAWSLAGYESLQQEWDEMIAEWEKNPCSPEELCRRVLSQQGESSPCWIYALATGFLFKAGDQRLQAPHL